MPKRIQRKRTKGWCMPPNTVYVGRPSKWGNPWSIADAAHSGLFNDDDIHKIVSDEFSHWLAGDYQDNDVYRSLSEKRESILSKLYELRGKNLACWCSLDKPCHADVLLKLANTVRWGGLYREQWWNKIVQEAFSHPAKFAPGLIDKIYEFLIERGDLQVGDTAVDPFGGVALGARSAMANGINWRGVELEQRFVDIGGGVACDGYSKEDWRRINGRADAVRANGRDGRKLCPACVAELDNTDGIKRLTVSKYVAVDLFGYADNHRAIPSRIPHEYGGNIGKWADEGVPKHVATAVLVQGDSRDFANILAGVANDGRVKAAVSSPPFGQGETRNRSKFSDGEIASMMSRAYTIDRQGADSGNLAALGDGGFQAAVSSPPYADVVKSGEGTGVRFDTTHHSEENGRKQSSRSDYGAAAGNLGNMSADGYQAAVSSPPFEDSLSRDWWVQSSRRAVADAGGITNTDKVSPIDMELVGGRKQTYGRQLSNIGNDSGETFWSAARVIVEQTYAVLQPGGVAAWVCKDFVRNKQIVRFSDQWEELCLAVGFEFDVRIRAMLIDERGYQLNVFGGKTDKSVKRMSFFRRLHETKYPHLAIDWEDVVIVRKPMEKE